MDLQHSLIFAANLVQCNATPMKKVLILAYDFPPYVSVGGLRPYNWFKYLKEFGVEPVVITRQWSNEYGSELDYIAPSKSKETIVEETDKGTIYRSPYKPNLSNRLLLKHGENRFRIIRKLISAYFELVQFLYVTGPKKELYKIAKEYLKENKVDAIIATGEPFVLFSYASKLSKEFNIPWIADYRDPWSQNKNRSGNFILKQWNNYFEKKLLSTSTSAATVSEFCKLQIKENIQNKLIHILPNGYDDELINEVSCVEQNNEVLSIAFVGSIYKWHPWQSFILCFCEYVIENPKSKIQVNFYGVGDRDQIEGFISKKHPELIHYFSFTPRIPNKEVIERLAQNNVMLLFNDYSVLGTKIYDYLGVKRKILLCFSDDLEANKLKEKHYAIEEIEGVSDTLQADLILETNSGLVVKDSKHLQLVLNDLWKEFSSTKRIECNSIEVEKFSRKVQVEKLASILKNSSN